jgi:hypothetical protein
MNALQDDPSVQDVLTDTILGHLAAMFTAASRGDASLAHQAARLAVAAYAPASAAELMTVAQLIGFDLAALASLGSSFQQNTDPALALRLRANAAAMRRAAAAQQKALAGRPAVPAPQPVPPPEPARGPEPRDAWAAAMETVAKEYQAEIAASPGADRRTASLRAQALRTTAVSLLSDPDPGPYRSAALPRPVMP